MAITLTGSVLTFAPASTNTGTVSSTITVPADAEIVVVGWSSFSVTSKFFSTGSMTFTKGGVDTAMTAVSGGDTSTGAFMAAMFYLALPDTGSNKTLKWDWLGAASADDAAICAVAFFKGIDTSSPVRGTGGGQASPAPPYTSSTITALTGDLIVAMAAGSAPAEGTATTWSNLSTLSQIPFNPTADGAMATGSPTGDTIVALTAASNWTDGGIVAISLKPAPIVIVVVTALVTLYSLNSVW